MGICCHRPIIERQLTKELHRDRKIDIATKKLLILGPKKSGKSTILNQLKYIHGNGFDHVQKMEAKQLISSFIIESMQNIIECIEEYEKFKQYPITQFSLNNEGKLSAKFIKSLSLKQTNINKIIASHLEILCKQNGIKKILSNPCKYYIDYSIIYFLNNLQRLCKHDYIPSDQDIIQLRIKCDGFNETEIEMAHDKFICYDVNYKTDICKKEKFIHCFENVTCILFVASLSSFDEPIFDNEKSYLQKLKWKQSLSIMEGIVGDDILSLLLSFVGYPKNAMHDSLDVFDQLCNNEWFKNIPVLLFMNKSDLFRSKMDQLTMDERNEDDLNGFNVCFPKFKGKCDYTTCSEYIMKQFLKRNKSKHRRIFKHIVNGTDTTIMRKIFNDVQNIVINASLDQAGLL